MDKTSEGAYLGRRARRWAWIVALTVGLGTLSVVYAAQFPVSVVDDRGRTIVLTDVPERIIAVGSLYAQILVDLGAADLLVAVSESTDNPAEVAALPSVGPSFGPSAEWILSFSPDLVLGATDWDGVRSTLERAGVPVYTLPWLSSVSEVLRAIETVGGLVGALDAARPIVDGIAERILKVESRVRGAIPVRVAYVYAPVTGFIYAMGLGTAEHDLLVRAGGENVFSDIAGYAQISMEELVARNPDVLVADPSQLPSLRLTGGLATVSAIVHGRLVGVPARWITSTQIGRAFETLANAFHPEAVPH